MKIDPHQRVAIDRLSNGNILAGGTGVGKSRTVIAYFIEKVCGGTIGEQGDMKTPRDMIVLTTAKKRDSLDWEREAVAFKFGKDRSLSQDGIRIVVDSWNNIAKYKSVQNAFFVFDEQRVVGSGKWSNAFIKIAKRNQWVLLSATPGDTWLDYVPVFIANGFYKNRSEFKERHVVYNAYAKYPKVDKYIAVNHLVKLRNSILVPMPFPRHTVRHPHDIEVDFDVELERRVREDRWHVYEEKPLRDIGEMFIVMRKVVNSDASRLRAVQSLLAKHPKLIVFYSTNAELEKLRTLSETQPPWEDHPSANTGETSRVSIYNPESPSTSTSGGLLERNAESFSTAEWNGHKHEPIPKTDRWVYLVQYAAGAEGWNCIETDAICFYSLTYSYKLFDQAHGRIDRMNTPFRDLHYYYLLSKSMIDEAVMRALRNKRSFTEKGLNAYQGGFGDE